MNTEQLILKYLQHRGIVEVAGFGVFSLENAEAQLDEASGKILPPSQKITFHSDYHTADGGFIPWLAKEQNTSIEKAQQELLSYTNFWKTSLEQGNNVLLKGIGTMTIVEDQLTFQGERIYTENSDFYGLEEINLQELKKKTYLGGDYRLNRSILWWFLILLPTAGLLVLAFTQRERLFGKASFAEVSVKTSTHRITVDSAKIKAEQEVLKQDSIRRDSILQDSIRQSGLPVVTTSNPKKTSKFYKKTQWKNSKKRANRSR